MIHLNYNMVFAVVVGFSELASLSAQSEQEGATNETSVNSFFIQSGYISNTSSFGTFNTEVKQPSFSANMGFESSHHFNLGFGYMAINNSDDSLKDRTHEFDLSVGYEYSLPLKLFLYGYYMHSFFSENSSLIRSGYKDELDLDLGYDGKWIAPLISATYLPADKSEFLLNAGTSFNLETENFPVKKSSLVFMPGINLQMGKLQFYNEYLIDQFRQFPSLYIYYRRRLHMTNEQIKELLLEDKHFTLTSMDLSCPINLEIGNWTLSGSINAVKPFNQPSFIGNDWVFYYSASIEWMINWK
jgi:hypothetical protein